MFRVLSIAAALVLTLAVSRQTIAQESEPTDCAQAERYHSLAQEQVDANDDGQAVLLLEQATAACPKYEYFQELGELRTRTVNQFDRQLAVDAFVRSHALASTDRQRARALWKYAALLNQEGDPQNADPLIREARRLDAGNEQIADLAAEIQEKIENPTREFIVRGLASSLYQPLQTQAASGEVASADSGPATAVASSADGAGASIRIPINFEFNSTAPDSATSRNIEMLASSLSEPDFQDRDFIFVGHADVRGDAQYNKLLSRRRAYAVYEIVVGIEPGLEGRISVKGMGESEPIEPGNTEEAHRANRRLQVIVK
ncbi:MAG: OmpA family protein [Gammaproteobacteria bacterium]|nr:OmpA family protein [Gammaproteobacteria bacterium]